MVVSVWWCMGVFAILGVCVCMCDCVVFHFFLFLSVLLVLLYFMRNKLNISRADFHRLDAFLLLVSRHALIASCCKIIVTCSKKSGTLG